MSRHEGVSCDSCLVGNFRGKRYKCLVCYDYDLCATCYEAGATNTRHTTAHPMQCILTRSDFDLYYGGEAVSVEQPQAFTCPLCGKMGFTEGTLQEHVSSTHLEPSPYELVCPICAALPGGDPNLVTDDFAAHLMLEHRSPRDLDEPASSRQVRRIPHPGRGVGATRTRRANMHFSSSGGLTSLSPGSRDSMDPIAELLSQLSGVRRSGGASPSQTTSQLQQLQMQLQLERQQVLNSQVGRQHLDRVPRRQAQVVGSSSAGGGGIGQVLSSTPGTITFQSGNNGDNNASKSSAESSQFLLPRYVNPRLSDRELEENELEQNYHSAFVCELLMNALVEGLPMDIVNLSPMKTLPWHLTDEGELSSALQSQKEESSVAQVDSATTFQPQIQEASQPSSVSLSPSPSNSKQTGNNMTSATSKKNQVHPSGSTNRVVAPTASRSSAPTASTGQQTSTRETSQQQQQSSTVGSNGFMRGSSSNVSQQQHLPPPQRLAPQGTGTVREIPVPQAVVTGRMPPVRGGTSPSSSTRRKMVRHMDGRNQANDPPPPH